MIKKKICLLGAFGVGKSSLIRKYVLNVFSEEYLSTVGVKIDKKVVALEDGTELTLLIWDMEGRDDFSALDETYLRGMAGCLLVADGTRPETLASAETLRARIAAAYPGTPALLLINKKDLPWKIVDGDWSAFPAAGVDVLPSSAKTGLNVEAAFADLAAKLLSRHAQD